MRELGLDRGQRAGKLSGGQQAQLALTLAVAKRPELLLLDEPVASLDPLARREFLQTLMAVVVDHDVSVVLSSHLVADLERVCDHLVVLVSARVALTGDVDDLLASHRRLIGPRRDPSSLPSSQTVIEASHTDRQSTLIVRTDEPIHDPAWTVEEIGLEGSRPGLHGPERRRSEPVALAVGGPVMTWLAWRQFRTSAVVAGFALAVMAVLLAITTHGAHALACTGGGCPESDGKLWRLSHDHLLAILSTLLVGLPAIAAIFWGAPLVARELESGTYRLAWTQSVTRTRWLTTKLALIGLAGAVLCGLLSAMLGWWSSAAGVNRGRLAPDMFAERGITRRSAMRSLPSPSRLLPGALIRRTLPAMGVTLVGFTAARMVIAVLRSRSLAADPASALSDQRQQPHRRWPA